MPFFAWAPELYVGPSNWDVGGAESGDDYRPRVIVVEGYNRVTLSAPEDATWRHGSPDEWSSNAAGLGTSVLTHRGYIHEDYGSHHIKHKDALPLNALVAMFGYAPDTPPTEELPTEVEYVGLGDDLYVPSGYTHLYLGMHDGYEWSTNSNDDGPVVVTITPAKKVN